MFGSARVTSKTKKKQKKKKSHVTPSGLFLSSRLHSTAAVASPHKALIINNIITVFFFSFIFLFFPENKVVFFPFWHDLGSRFSLFTRLLRLPG